MLPEAVVSEFTSTLAVLQHKKIKELEKTCKSTIYNNKIKQKNKSFSPLLKPLNIQGSYCLLILLFLNNNNNQYKLTMMIFDILNY
jgi:hypothetical protein